MPPVAGYLYETPESLLCVYGREAIDIFYKGSSQNLFQIVR
jgi:hypothetical protein